MLARVLICEVRSMTCVAQTNEYGYEVRHLIRRRDERTTRSVGSSCVKKPAVLENVIGPGVSWFSWSTETTLTIDDLGRAM